LLSVPVLKGEAFGVYQLESLACGIPLVQPQLGAFPEIIEQTGGGVTYGPNTAEELCKSWANTLVNNDKINTMSKAGYDAVLEKYNIDKVSESVLSIYKSLTDDN